MQQWLVVGIAGAVGSMSRYGAGLLSQRLLGQAAVYGTFAVNVLGSILLGLTLELFLQNDHWSPQAKLAVGTGFCGAFTTFSTFSVETLRLVEAGQMGSAAGNVGANLVFGLGGAALGIWLARLAS